MTRKFRTAVLVVHGMGSQRPLETVRGVINAVWFDDDNDHAIGGKKLWSHPEPSGVDLDLTVMTTNKIPESEDGRVADFHELYWAHHMSETKSVAVLLWLFELGRRGPHFKTGMNGLWRCGAIYLCLLLLSAAQLSAQAIIWFSNIVGEPYGIPVTAYIMIGVGVTIGCIAAYFCCYLRLGTRLLVAVGATAAIALVTWAYVLPTLHAHNVPAKLAATFATNLLLVPFIAVVATAFLMHKPGLHAFFWALVLSWAFFGLYRLFIRFDLLTDGSFSDMVLSGRVPWGLNSKWSCVAALIIFGIYLIVDTWFLQPYLGDAARYFRNSPANVAVRRAIRRDAVDTLNQLHRSRDYDRIVVVAHSLGTAVAYDMLRNYYSRICSQIRVDAGLKLQFAKLDGGELGCEAMRAVGRNLIRTLAERSVMLNRMSREGAYRPANDEDVDAWLVTDFVTLGSPLTHAKYLMTNEEHGEHLDQDFSVHVHEREYPTCPPQQLDDDGLIFFTDPRGELRVHHGGMFGMTRWTNLYFEMKEIFWGDAIGGEVAKVFGDCVKDVKVWTGKPGVAGFFTHTAYWKTNCENGRKAPHIQALREAINLEDKPAPKAAAAPAAPA